MTEELSHATFIHAVKVGAGSSTHNLTDKTHSLSRKGDFIVVQERKNNMCTALVPMSNVAYVWVKTVEVVAVDKKPIAKGANA